MEESAPGLIQSDDSKIKINTTKKMYQDGKHYNKHGRAMGYASKKEYDQAAKEFVIANMNNPDAKVYRGKWNGTGVYKNEYQIIIIYNGRQVVLLEETGKVIDFLEGTELKGQISVEELR